MTGFFTIAIFLAAALLFGVQPMVAKSLLPGFGGGSSVWTTCMLFFQSLLIAGYLYAHVLLRMRRGLQWVIHTIVITAALISGWLFSEPSPPPNASEFPVPWLLGQLFLIAGLPYFAVSSAGPLIQGWFARTGHARAQDPYFLYAASNAGSFIGLLSYPLFVEPRWGLSDQRSGWLVLFAVFALMAGVCVWMARHDLKDDQPIESEHVAEPVTWKRRLGWIFLAFVPSSMLLAVTTHLTTEVASFPLLWVVPLAVYLLTMIAAFSRGGPMIVRFGARPMIVTIIAAWVLLVAWDRAALSVPVAANFAVQLALLLSVGCYGHGRLAGSRPHPSRLTEFYLLISIGGAMGGLFNGVLAPLVFDDVYEYHASLVLALLMLPSAVVRFRSRAWLRSSRLLIPAGSLLVVILTAWLLMDRVQDPSTRVAITAIPAALLVYMGWRDRFASAGALLFPALALVLGGRGAGIEHRERTFFGVHEIVRTQTEDRVFRRLIHGTTLHGLEMIEGPGPRGVPLGYYHPRGPLGGLFTMLGVSHPGGMRAGLVGLGTGAIAAYSRADDVFTFYEIDPAVARIASDPQKFSFVDAAAGTIEIRLGDGRLLLEAESTGDADPFDLLVIDAFSSDAIPTHLLTLEAIELYRSRLGTDGVVAMHISNRHLDLSGLLLIAGREVGWTVLINDDGVDQEYTERTGHFSSTWIAMTGSSERAAELARRGFVPYERPGAPGPWTDERSDLLGVWGFD
ncbi:MAG: fused MFS/spermidine synthase [Planctomycetota bacterium]